MTLTIQTTCERMAGELSFAFSERAHVDERIATLQRLIDDRDLILAAHDGHGIVPRAVLERHGWLTIHEARLNVRDAPDWWLNGRAAAIEQAAERGADWLEAQGIFDGDTLIHAA